MRVSIITVVYNNHEGIGRTVEAVLGQSVPPMEYLIIDGGSRDGTLERAESFREAMGRRGIDYRILSEPDGGIYDAMNKGIRLAKGEIIGLTNSGDWYEPDALEQALGLFEREGCELMFGDLRIHRRDGSSFVKKARLRRFQTSRDWNHPTMFVKAELYKAYPFRNLGIHDDYGFYLQMLRQGRKVAVCSSVLANFQMGGASNRKSLRRAAGRIRDRYLYCYRINGYSRWYLAECVLTEAAKLILG